MTRSQRPLGPGQMLFVKNVPQEWVSRIIGLYELYTPLQTKNLYPHSGITTLMVGLPSVACADNALRDTDGAKIGNSVLSVERYNKRQSTVAGREARKRAGDLGCEPTNAVTTSYCEEDHDGYNADEDSHVEIEVPASPVDIATETSNPTCIPSRKNSRDNEHSWANVASGALTDQCAPSTTPPDEESARRPHTTTVFTRPSKNAKQGRSTTPLPSANGTDLYSRASLPLKGTFTSPGKTPSKPAPILRAVDPKRKPLIALITATKLPDSQSAGQRPPINGGPLDAQVVAIQENLASVHVTESRSNEDSPAEKVHSQQRKMQDTPQQPRTGLAMPTDTTWYIQQRHCNDCAFCQMRLAVRNSSTCRRVASDDVEGNRGLIIGA